MLRPKISIIVPVYNASAYLKDCLESILTQTFTDFELILVCDNPTDGSDRICEEYASRDSRLRILRNAKNLHIGLSRNRGLDIATGDYIAFSDDDDLRDIEMYDILYQRAKENNADMVVGVTINKIDNTNIEFAYPQISETNFKSFLLTDLIGNGNFHADSPYCLNIHPHLYKRDVIEKYHIRFVDTRFTAPEDRLFNIEFLLYSSNLALERRPLYYHRIISSSAGHNASYSNFDKHISYIDTLNNILMTTKNDLAFAPNFLIGANKFLLADLCSLLVQGNLHSYIKACGALKDRKYSKSMARIYHAEDSDKLWVKIVKRLITLYLG